MTLPSLQMFNSDIQRSSRFLLFFHPSHGNHLQSPEVSLSGCPTQEIYLPFPAVSFSTCPSSLSVAEIRHRPEGTPGGTGCLVYRSKPLSIVEGRNSSRGRNRREKLLTGLLPGSHSAGLLIPPRTHCTDDSTIVGWAFPHQSTITKMPQRTVYRPILMGAFLPSGFPDPEWLQFVLVFVNRLYRDLALVFLPPAPCSLS